MSNYYQYNFISSENLVAIVKEELKSYFDTGSIDDMLFSTYINKALRKLDRSSYKITEDSIIIEDFEARLPDNFYAVREAWMCADMQGVTHTTPNSTYIQNVTILPSLDFDRCNNTNITNIITNPPQQSCIDSCDDIPCKGNNLGNIIKLNETFSESFRKVYLLKPGNISNSNNCYLNYSDSLNQFGQNNFIPYSSSIDTFEIRDNKFITNFRNGVIHLLFYADTTDDCGNQLVPDNYRILEYIEKFLKFKVFETLTNQVNDETFNQLQQKMLKAEQEYNEAYIIALTEVKKQTVYKKQQTIQTQRNRFNNFRIR